MNCKDCQTSMIETGFKGSPPYCVLWDCPKCKLRYNSILKSWVKLTDIDLKVTESDGFVTLDFGDDEILKLRVLGWETIKTYITNDFLEKKITKIQRILKEEPLNKLQRKFFEYLENELRDSKL